MFVRIAVGARVAQTVLGVFAAALGRLDELIEDVERRRRARRVEGHLQRRRTRRGRE